MSTDSQKLPQIDFTTEASNALETLEAAVIDYQAKDGKPNLPLIEARNEVAKLEAQLTEARVKLKELEAKGTWLDHFNQAVYTAESRVQGLLSHYDRLVESQLLEERFGQAVPVNAVGRESRKELRQLHVRLTNLKRFIISRRGDFDQVTPEYLYARAEKAGATLDALRQYIAQDQEAYTKKS